MLIDDVKLKLAILNLHLIEAFLYPSLIKYNPSQNWAKYFLCTYFSPTMLVT